MLKVEETSLGTEGAGSADTPVLIVGGGPVGLSLALELSYHGIKCLLVDQGDGVVRLSKMGHVSVRSMEHCRRWGIANDVRNCGFPDDFPLNQIFCTSLNGQLITTLEYPSGSEDQPSYLSPEKKQRCPQLWFDPILARAAQRSNNVTLRYRTRLVEFRETEVGVLAILESLDDGTRETVHAGYLAGCDGAGSRVRKALEIDMQGDPVLSYSTGIYFTSRDLLKHQNVGIGSRYWMVGAEGVWGNLTVVDAKDVWRLTITGSKERVEAENFDADGWLRRCLGRDDIEYSITAVLPWRRSRLVARTYSRGRVFLAGDACHVNAPNGGYGMNTGLGDAVDLGWKLAATLQGWGGKGLLESYEIERQPVAQRNVDAAAYNFNSTKPNVDYSAVADDGDVGQVSRSAIARAMSQGTRQEFETYGVHLGYRYEGSPIIVPDGTPMPEDHLSDYAPTARPGHRAPHVALSEEHSTIDLFGKGFVLLQLLKEDKANVASCLKQAAMSKGVPLRVEVVSDAEVHDLYEAHYILVRPDGHVAWRGDELGVDAGELVDIVTGRTC